MVGKILIVDDVATNRIVFKVKLGAACYQPILAADGAGCLRMAHEEQPDLILLDLMLPDMSGVEVLHQLREMPQGRDALCIAMSADVSANPVQRARDEGFADFWPKPLDVASMLARLDEAIASLTAPA